jgi:hypothetical protein
MDQTQTLTSPPDVCADARAEAAIRRAARRALERSSFCTLATSSGSNRPHVVGVMYVAVDDVLYVHTFDTSRKARNVRENPRVGVCVPVRRYPFGPPFCLQFQASVEMLGAGDPGIRKLAAAGRLKAITSHGELEAAGSCFLRITPSRKVSTYGLGLSLLQILRDPFSGSRTVTLRQHAA